MIQYQLTAPSFHSEQTFVKKILVSGQTWYLNVDLNDSSYQAYLRWLEEGNTPLPADEAERARNADGTFIGDDPATPGVNEAWVDGGQE